MGTVSRIRKKDKYAKWFLVLALFVFIIGGTIL